MSYVKCNLYEFERETLLKKPKQNTHLQIKKTFYLSITFKYSIDFYHFLLTGEPECLEGDLEAELE